MRHFQYVFVLFLVFISCTTGNESSNSLESLIQGYQNHKGYDAKEYPLGLSTRKYYKAESEFADSLLVKLALIKEDGLAASDKISLELLKFVLQDDIDYYNFERFLNPLLSDSGFHSNLNYSVRPFRNYKQVKRYLQKLNAIPVFVDQHFVNLREGLEKGVSQPRVIFKGYESTYNSHIVKNYEDSFFYSPFKKLPESLTAAQKDSVLTVAKVSIEKNVTPQFKRIKTFFETEYLPKTRTTLGASDTPNGAAYYQNRINFYTTSTQYTADDIHQIGLKEVARIKAEMQKNY